MTNSSTTGGPDVVLSDMIANTTDLVPGGSLTLTYTIENCGDEGFGSSGFTQFYLSDDAIIDATDTLIGSQSFADLSAGTTDIETETFTFSNSIPNGTYWIGAIADATDQIEEVNESNNDDDPIQITINDSALPDLTVSNFQLHDPGIIIGNSITASWNVLNVGQASVGSGGYAGLYISTNPTLTASDHLLYELNFSALGSLGADTSNWANNIQLPEGFGPGTYWVGVIADNRGLFTEADEQNNITTPQELIVYPEGSIISGNTLPQLALSGTLNYSTAMGDLLINNNPDGLDDRVVFTDLNLSDLHISSHDYTAGGNIDHSLGVALELRWATATDTGTIQFANMGDGIEAFEFADGTVLSSIDADYLQYHDNYGLSDDPIRASQYENDPRDRLFGTSGDDVVTGTTDSQQIYTYEGNDTLNAGGNSGHMQYLYGGEGDDTYIITNENGDVTINNHGENDSTGANDRIIFTDINLEDITISTRDYTNGGTSTNHNGIGLRLEWNTGVQTGSLTVANMGASIEAFEFADGTVISQFDANWLQFHENYGLSSDPVRAANYANDPRDRIWGTDGDDTITASEDTYIIYAGDGDDTLSIGQSAGYLQYLSGGRGDDTYVIDRVNGQVMISNSGETSTSGNADRVVFSDLNLADVTFSTYDYTQGGSVANAQGIALQINWDINGEAGWVRIAHMGEYIEAFEFADGSVLQSIDADWLQYHDDYGQSDDPVRAANYADDPRDRIWGTDGDDTITASADTYIVYAGHGDDTLSIGDAAGYLQYLNGNHGNDTYVVESRNGEVMITGFGETETSGDADRVVFLDIDLANVTFSTHDYTHGGTVASSHGVALEIQWDQNGEAGMIRIANMGEHIEVFEFADGSVLGSIDADWLQYHDDYGQSDDPVRAANYVDDPRDRIWGTSSDDIITASADTYIVYSGDGDDVLSIGEDAGYLQYLSGAQGNDTYVIDQGNGQVMITNAGETNTSGNADRVVFSDIDLADVTFTTHDYTQGGTIANPQGIALQINWDIDGEVGWVRIAHMGEHIEAFEFADGTVLSRIDADWLQHHPDYGLSSDPARAANYADDQRDRVWGTDANDVIAASVDTYIIYAGDGDDTISIGQDIGFLQYLNGGRGNDTYIIDNENGEVMITGFGESALTGNADRIVFNDVDLSDVTFDTFDYTQGGSVESDHGIALEIHWDQNGEAGMVRIANMGEHIEAFEFADGSVYQYDDFGI